jgi:hypothetical protein
MNCKIFSIIFLCLLNIHIYACECSNRLIDLPLEEMGWLISKNSNFSTYYSDLVFNGILIKEQIVEEIEYNSPLNDKKQVKELTFRVLDFYKGEKNDTIKIRTNLYGSNCGFWAKVNTQCLIFAARSENGNYYTSSSECCRSISKNEDEKRYDNYKRFLDSMTKMIDGNYIFYQSNFDVFNHPDSLLTSEAIKYTIKNGKLDGLWKVTDRKGRVVEKGFYKIGEKIGTWKIISEFESDYYEYASQTIFEKIKYKNGKPRKSITTIIDTSMDFEKEEYLNKIIRKQKIKKRYKYKEFTPLY